MSEMIQVPRSEWHSLKRAVEIIASNEKANDLINRDEACKLLNWTSDYFSKKRIPADSINDWGVKFYSKQRLLGLKNP